MNTESVKMRPHICIENGLWVVFWYDDKKRYKRATFYCSYNACLAVKNGVQFLERCHWKYVGE